jgi:hypothetical protein
MGLGAYYFGSGEQKTHLHLQSVEYYQGFQKENCSVNYQSITCANIFLHYMLYAHICTTLDSQKGGC